MENQNCSYCGGSTEPGDKGTEICMECGRISITIKKSSACGPTESSENYVPIVYPFDLNMLEAIAHRPQIIKRNPVITDEHQVKAKFVFTQGGTDKPLTRDRSNDDFTISVDQDA